MATTVALVIAMAGTALASGLFIGATCGVTDMPGHSEYAQNHIAHSAQEGLLGNEGHKPGVAHQGLSGMCPGKPLR